MLTHFSTFSGIGGLDLAAEWAGFQTVGQVEKAEFPYKVLSKHWPNVPKWRDIRDVTDDAIRKAGIGPVTVVSGGFPCQPFSTAGKREGERDDRFLWPEMLRVIELFRPTWFVGENVAGIIDMALDRVLSDLEDIGYTCRAFNIPSAAVEAPHPRQRIFIVAHVDALRDCSGEFSNLRVGRNKQTFDEAMAGNRHVADNNRSGFSELEERDSARTEEQEFPARCQLIGRNAYVADLDLWKQSRGLYSSGNGRQLEQISWNEISWPEAATRFCGVDDGVSDRVDRIKTLGNAVVPQQAYPIFKAIAQIEELEWQTIRIKLLQKSKSNLSDLMSSNDHCIGSGA
jgi:DNA (cytosine-5)-methyltransferase 1